MELALPRQYSGACEPVPAAAAYIEARLRIDYTGVGMVGLPIVNPFPGAESLLVGETESTQDEARRLARRGFPSGSVVAADFQSAGRGRGGHRRWVSEPGKNLLFTIRLDPSYSSTPALPLRVAAALCRAVAALAAARGADLGDDGPRIKWPNDLLLGGRKAAGILCEAGAEGVYLGVGVNCNQRSFPAEIAARATSLAIAFGAELDRWRLLERFLGELKLELESDDWKPGVERLLWRRGEIVRFVPGLPDSGEGVEARLEGLDSCGSLLLARDEGSPAAYPAGELLLDAAFAIRERR
jgi:BirA family biotin operon repressor/biotin-[acetyl-CoA-carboxylase] ligase